MNLRTRLHLPCFSLLAALVLCPALTRGAEDAGAGVLVLDESTDWRCYMQFERDRIDARTLKADGEKIVGDKALARLEKSVKNVFSLAGIEKDWTQTDWKEEACFFVTQITNVGSDDLRTWVHISGQPPPAKWTAPEFDDGDWFCQRLPMLAGNFSRPGMMHGDSEKQTATRRACLRGTFEVPAPDAAGEYTLNLTFRGGARVFLNGQEVARAFLPAGELGPQASAEVYPAEAYLCQEDEREAKPRANIVSRVGADYCMELPGRFEDSKVDAVRRAKPDDPNVYACDIWGVGDVSINHKAWDRLTALRNRSLGALKLPRNLIRKGSNVLAVEIVAADLHPVVATGRWTDSGMVWVHCRLLNLALRCSGANAPSALKRPARPQVWVEDIHRQTVRSDFASRQGSGMARVVGAPGGNYGFQILAGADQPLSGLKVTPGELKAEGGASIPAAAIQVSQMAPHSFKEIVKLGQIRNFPDHRKDPLCPPAEMALLRYGPAEARAARLPRERRLAEIEKLEFFDHIAPGLPQQVAAGTSQALWCTLSIPTATAPGVYRGNISVEAQGLEAVQIPLVAEVYGWRVPEPKHLQTVMALEQSPYGVAKQYGVPLWSDEHFRLMEGSYKQLARAGNDWIFVPIAMNSEFGNKRDSVVPWTRKKDGSWSFDYSRLDRYLDLAVKHLGVPRVISFVVMHGGDDYGGGNMSKIEFLDEATGKNEVLEAGSQNGDPAHWKAFATSLYQHMKARGQERSMHWGFGWDSNGDPGLIPLLAKYTPEVKWTRGAHGLGDGSANDTFIAASRIYGVQLTPISQMGWKNRFIYMLLPRSGSSILSCNGHSPPFTFRLMVDRALVAGLNGVARLGVDYWADSYFEASKVPSYAVGMPCVQMFWPGKDGAESSARFEVLCEGLQETEARIFMEQALDRGLISGETAAKVKNVLFEHNRETLFMSVGSVGVQVQEYCAGWQERSRRLYSAAQEVAKAGPFDVYPNKIETSIVARSSSPLSIRLRNWSGAPRAWKASASAEWLVLARSAGQLSGQEELGLSIDSSKLKPNEKATGQVVVTDEAGGKTHTIEIVALTAGAVCEFVVGEAYDFLATPAHAASWAPKRIEDQAVFNVTAGESQTREFTLANKSGSPLEWKIESSSPWLKPEPSSGTLPPYARTHVNMTARPPDTAACQQETILKISEGSGDGKTTQSAKIVTIVIPPYQEPALPKGQAVAASTLPKTLVKSHRARAYWFGSSDASRPDFGPHFDKDGNIGGGVAQDTVYKLEGSGITAFSAKVQVDPSYVKQANTKDELHTRRISFELWADGKVVAQSGLMKSGDAPRLLVAEGLATVKELRLLTRFDTPEARNLLGTPGMQWLQPSFYK